LKVKLAAEPSLVALRRAVPHRPLPRLHANSGLPEFGRFIDWPKSETSDFGWRDRERACDKLQMCTFIPLPNSPRKRGSKPNLPLSLIAIRGIA